MSSNLPPAPRNWREMQPHPHKEGFFEAAKPKLLGKKTFKYVKRPKRTQIVPLLWVFDRIQIRQGRFIVLQPNDIIISLAETIWLMLAALTLGLQLLFVEGTGIIYRRGILLFSMKDEDHE
jgi:hypothetical protein